MVAIAWREKQLLLDKWGDRPVNRALVTELVGEKMTRVLRGLRGKGQGWTVHYAFLGRSDFGAAARAEASRVRARLINLEQLEGDLAE